jgi:hypothetical protein
MPLYDICVVSRRHRLHLSAGERYYSVHCVPCRAATTGHSDSLDTTKEDHDMVQAGSLAGVSLERSGFVLILVNLGFVVGKVALVRCFFRGTLVLPCPCDSTNVPY